MDFWSSVSNLINGITNRWNEYKLSCHSAVQSWSDELSNDINNFMHVTTDSILKFFRNKETNSDQVTDIRKDLSANDKMSHMGNVTNNVDVNSVTNITQNTAGQGSATTESKDELPKENNYIHQLDDSPAEDIWETWAIHVEELETNGKAAWEDYPWLGKE